MQKHKKKLIWGAIIVVAVGLMIFGSRNTAAGTWADTEVACLLGGHQNALTHIHADLSVFIDGQEQSIPANVGVNNTCMAEVHTHTADGEIHVETPGSSADRTLTDFFAVWEEPLERDGYNREVLVNGASTSLPYTFVDGDTVVVRFTSATSSAVATTTTEAATTSPQE